MNKITINVYGTGINAVNFVLSNRDIKIAAFIEGRDCSKKEFMKNAFTASIPVVWREAAETVLRKNYTVVASSINAYWIIKERLEKEYGLIEFEDFEYYTTFRKKIAVIYGNCHTVPIRQILELSKEFNDTYGFYPLKTICEMKECGGIGLESRVYERCELFIHQCIREGNLYGMQYASKNLLRKLPARSKVIGIPNLYRLPRFLFPQVDYDKDASGVRWESYNYFPFRDKYIDANYKKMSVSQICEMIRDDLLIKKEDILIEQDKFWTKVETREEEWDIKIVGYLKDNMREKRLFYDPNHPCNDILKYIALKILSILRMDAGVLETDGILKLDTLEIPIYEAVCSALKLQYRTNYIRKNNRLNLNTSQMDLEEYVRQYVAWNYPLDKAD